MKRKIPATWCIVAVMFLGLHFSTRCQTTSVVIAEVMYDHPLYDNEAVKTGQEGEFLSLYNYDEEDVDISGWRIEISDLTASLRTRYQYTVPANTILPESGTAIIASRNTNSHFDLLQFYGMEAPEEEEGYLLLYTSSLAFPDTRTRIRVYDTRNNLQDELVYDGNSEALTDEPLLRAVNKVNHNRPLSETVSIQREKIIVEKGTRTISRTDFFTPDPERTVQLLNYLPFDYSYTSPSFISNDTPETDTLILSGRVMENQDHRATHIVSTQVLERGNTFYLSEESIVLGDGFELKDGVEFGVSIERDSFHLVDMLTYNLSGIQTLYTTHAKYIKQSKAAVVALQEIALKAKFKNLKKACGLDGDMKVTIYLGLPSWLGFLKPIAIKYGIGLLWNPDIVGAPIAKSYKTIKTPNDKFDKKRAYMVAEFNDFCFVSTHLSHDSTHRTEMVKKIIENEIIQKCHNVKKPIYIAGDMNEGPGDPAIKILRKNGYEVLNNLERNNNGFYVDATYKDKYILDLVLEYNQNPYHKTIFRGIPMDSIQKVQFFNDNISDHLPYKVKVKIK